jgi:hypothetical protein
MAITLTTVVKPTFLAPKIKEATYTVLWDSSYPTGGEAYDFTADFTYITSIIEGGNDTSADNAYDVKPLLPAPGTAITSSNVLLQMFSGGSEVANTTDLSAIGQTAIIVRGS